VSIEGWRSGVRRVTALGLVPVGAGPCAAVGLRAVESMQVCFRRRNRATAMLLRSMHAAGRATAAESLNDELDPFSGDEVAAGLGWSRSMSGRWLELAEDLQRRLPGVLAVMDQGPLDEGKARAISEWTRDLCPAHAEEVCAQVLGCAPGLALVGVDRADSGGGDRVGSGVGGAAGGAGPVACAGGGQREPVGDGECVGL